LFGAIGDFLGGYSVWVLIILVISVAGIVVIFLLFAGENDDLSQVPDVSRIDSISEAQNLLFGVLPVSSVKNVIKLIGIDRVFPIEDTTAKLAQAGYRETNAIFVYLFLVLISPCVFFALSGSLFFLILGVEPQSKALLFTGIGTLLGCFFPTLLLRNLIDKRQSLLSLSWPDALDLLLVSVQAGMSMELALQRMLQDMRQRNNPLLEELSILLAELSFLQTRRQAYENLVTRTGVKSIKNVVYALIQAERYGTPIGKALRVIAQESREERMAIAERKAAALPPKLTIPMVAFFLPILFMIILGPAVINVMAIW